MFTSKLVRYLKSLFPDILYQNPKSQSPKWSLDDGIKVKRTDNNKEPSISAWGLVDGQPTSKHFGLLIYDDVVTVESVTTPEQIKKTTTALEMSYNLGAHGGRRRFIGTRYHANDTYRTIMDRGTVKKRLYPATHNGKMDGNPVFLDEKTLKEKRRDMGPYTFGSQMLQDPVADKAMGFQEEWLRFYDKKLDPDNTKNWNKYLLVDPASKKKKNSDYTVMIVVGMAPDQNYYILDGIRDRLNLTERAKKVFEFRRKWMPTDIGYEEYGLQADTEHIQYVQEQENYRFNIKTLGGAVSKEDRIKKLIPKFEQYLIWLPKTLTFINYEKKVQDFVKLFIDDEYTSFPVCVHDDMLDCLARILEPELMAKFPEIKKKKQEPENYGGSEFGWMG